MKLNLLKKKSAPIIEKKEETLFTIKANQDIVELPDADKTQIDVKYPLLEPYAYVHIYWDSKSNELVYFIEEPLLDEKEKESLRILEEGIEELINISFINIKDQKTVIEYLEKNMRILLKELGIRTSKDSFLKMMYYIYRDFVGLNRIEPMMNDYFIEDLECNGSKTPLYIVHRKYRNLRTNVVFSDNIELARFVEKLAQKCGKYVSYANPLLDGRLPDGTRVNATYTEDISSRGPTFTLRKFTKEPWTPIKLMEFRTVSPEILAYLWILIEYENNIMIIGGTGSGKTSFLNSIAFFIPPAARVVSIEDTKELSLMHENWLPSVAREGIGLANIIGQKHGEVSLFDLLKESFRQRPDYVIVGEIRGKEAYVLFQGSASGHPTMATMHAESVETVVRRLQTPPIELPASLIETLDVVCVIAQAKVQGKDVRRIREVVEILKVMDNGEVSTNVPFTRDPGTDKFFFKANSYVFQKIMTRHGLTMEQIQREFTRRAMLLMKMYQNKIFGFKEVYEIINVYYKNPEAILKRFQIS